MRLEELADAELVRLARAHPHRRDAFEELARRHLPALERFCLHMGLDADAAADCAQETIVRAWLKAGQLRDPERFPAWLRGIAVRLVRDEERRRMRERRAWREAAERRPPAQDDPEARLLLERALMELSVEERAMLAMRAEGFSWREIAAASGMGESAAKMRVRRALARLRDRLGEAPGARP